VGYYLECDKICARYYDRNLREHCYLRCRFLIEEQRKIFENIMPDCIPERLRYELFSVLIGNKTDPETYSPSYVADRLASILQEISGKCPPPLLEDFLFKYVEQLWVDAETRHYILNTVRRQLASTVEQPVGMQTRTPGPHECLAICGGIHDAYERNSCIRRCLSILSHKPVDLPDVRCMSDEARAELFTLINTYKKYPTTLEDWQIVTRVSLVISKLLRNGCRKDEAAKVIIEALDQAGIPRHRIMRAYLHGTNPEVVDALYMVFPYLTPLYRPISMDLLEKRHHTTYREKRQHEEQTTSRKKAVGTVTKASYMIGIANLLRAFGFLLLFITALDVVIKNAVTYATLQVMLIGYVLSTLVAPILLILLRYKFILSYSQFLATESIGFLGLVPLVIYMWRLLQLNPAEALFSFAIPWISTSVIVTLQARVENWRRGSSYAMWSIFGIGYLLLAISKALDATMHSVGKLGTILFLVGFLILYIYYNLSLYLV